MTIHYRIEERRPTGSATETPVGQRKLKTPQARSDEEAEAEPTESEVACPVGFIHLYLLKLHFIYSLSASEKKRFFY